MIDSHHTNLYLAFMSVTGGIIHTAEWPYFSADYLLSAFSTNELRFTISFELPPVLFGDGRGGGKF
jgi:hypothetical protein